MTYKICVIGGEGLLMPFLQFGFATYTPPDMDALRTYIREAVTQGYGVFYIEDSYCPAIQDLMDEYRELPVPIFVPIGGDHEGDSYSDQAMRELKKKAAGISLP